MKENEENLKEKRRIIQKGAHNFHSKKRRRQKKEERENLGFTRRKTWCLKRGTNKNQKKKRARRELYLYSLSRAFVYISIHTHTHKVSWKKKKRYGENNASSVAVIRGGSAVNAEQISSK